MRIVSIVLLAGLLLTGNTTRAKICEANSVVLQILGSGGPELDDGRASSSYLLWHKNKARVMIDAGSGSQLGFDRSGARYPDLKAVLFTHLHVDHSADWPAYVKGAYFSERQSPLAVFGPDGNRYLPDIVTFHRGLFQQSWPYLNDAWTETDEPVKSLIYPTTVWPETGKYWQHQINEWALTAVRVAHGPLPALAWRVEIDGCAITFSGDTSAKTQALTELAKNSDILVTHVAIPPDAGHIAQSLHMTPARVGEIAAAANVGKLVLSHWMHRSWSRQEQVLAHIRTHYSGPIVIGADGLRIETP